MGNSTLVEYETGIAVIIEEEIMSKCPLLEVC
jgi:hypothetical protein